MANIHSFSDRSSKKSGKKSVKYKGQTFSGMDTLRKTQDRTIAKNVKMTCSGADVGVSNLKVRSNALVCSTNVDSARRAMTTTMRRTKITKRSVLSYTYQCVTPKINIAVS
jgi:hypothetical protein